MFIRGQLPFLGLLRVSQTWKGKALAVSSMSFPKFQAGIWFLLIEGSLKEGILANVRMDVKKDTVPGAKKHSIQPVRDR